MQNYRLIVNDKEDYGTLKKVLSSKILNCLKNKELKFFKSEAKNINNYQGYLELEIGNNEIILVEE